MSSRRIDSLWIRNRDFGLIVQDEMMDGDDHDNDGTALITT